MSIGTQTLNARRDSHNETGISRSDPEEALPHPADGFYEWRKMGSVKQPYCFEVGRVRSLLSPDCGMSGGVLTEKSLRVARS